MASALYLQYFDGLDPCPLCIFQRVGYIAAGAFFLVGALHNPKKIGRLLYASLAALSAIGGGAIAGRHIWLQNLPPEDVPGCGPGLDYILDVFPLQEALAMVFSGSGECAEIDWSMLGFSLPEVALGGFIVVTITAIAWAFWPTPQN